MGFECNQVMQLPNQANAYILRLQENFQCNILHQITDDANLYTLYAISYPRWLTGLPKNCLGCHIFHKYTFCVTILDSIIIQKRYDASSDVCLRVCAGACVSTSNLTQSHNIAIDANLKKRVVTVITHSKASWKSMISFPNMLTYVSIDGKSTSPPRTNTLIYKMK